jgi:hypothetical protein
MVRLLPIYFCFVRFGRRGARLHQYFGRRRVCIREVRGNQHMVITAFECIELAESLELIADVVICCPGALAD